MIVPMLKYTFLVYHKEYAAFLKDLQKLGVIHIVEKKEKTLESVHQKILLSNELQETIKYLQSRRLEAKNDAEDDTDGLLVLDEVNRLKEKLENLKQQLATVQKQMGYAEPWGNYNTLTLLNLKECGYKIRFFTCASRHYMQEWEKEYDIFLISRDKSVANFVIIQGPDQEKDVKIDAEEIHPPEKSLNELRETEKELADLIGKGEAELDKIASGNLAGLEKIRKKVENELLFERILLNTPLQSGEKVKVLEGWVPDSKKPKLENFLSSNNYLYFEEKPTPKDKVPILLKNSRFSRLVEPICDLYSLPEYRELDLVPFVAPFFMMFFGFCLGDAGYGLLYLLVATLFKSKVSEKLRPILTLGQFLGIGTFIFGAVSGTLFGMDLIKSDFSWTGGFKDLLLSPDKMFYLALGMGLFQIIFGIGVKAFNRIRQFGFAYSIGTWGWFGLILGTTVIVALNKLNVIGEGYAGYIKILLLISAVPILFFNDPEANVFVRIGKGLWDVYSTVTGIFGDLLSYIRLFALGLSSAILGYVINSIGMSILEIGPVIGHVLFAVFLILGHTLNIAIASLGAFVHPMRLTFVEFYKNAGFTGGGKKYEPFTNK
ncbi:V-type ATP synthase subunit I [candidate division KSB1 bacterium]|nr:V-type ATP synthase subunit I [candidate division KSB1 bacterium]